MEECIIEAVGRTASPGTREGYTSMTGNQAAAMRQNYCRKAA